MVYILPSRIRSASPCSLVPGPEPRPSPRVTRSQSMKDGTSSEILPSLLVRSVRAYKSEKEQKEEGISMSQHGGGGERMARKPKLERKCTKGGESQSE